MIFDLTYCDALAKRDHLKALGATLVYLREQQDDLPWAKASDIAAGGSYRLNGPVSFYVIAEDQGLTFKWSIDFEHRDANGSGTSQFDRAKLRDVIGLMPPLVRKRFAAFLADEVLPGLHKHTEEIREALNKQHDSEDCVRGLIHFAEQP